MNIPQKKCKKTVFTSHSIGSFAEYATVKGWFFVASICADDEGYHDNSDSQDKANGNHVGAVIYFRLKVKNLLIIYNDNLL